MPAIADERLHAYVASNVANENYRGAVHVSRAGETLLDAGFGPAAKDRKNAPRSSFLVGSLTKSFTAVLIMRLVAQDKLSLHEPIGDTLPGLPEELANLTLHELMRHQSGLRGHLRRLADYEDRHVTSDEVLAILKRARPGDDKRYDYSNLNYQLAAQAAIATTGIPWEQLMTIEVLSPAGMTDSGIATWGNFPASLSIGYENGTPPVPVSNNPSYALGSGDIVATVPDLARFAGALFDGTLLSEAGLAVMLTNDGEDAGYYGYGFRVQPYQRAEGQHGTLVRHGGSMNGYFANLHYYVEDDLLVIVTSNIRPFPIRDMTFTLKELVLGFAPGERSRRPVE